MLSTYLARDYFSREKFQSAMEGDSLVLQRWLFLVLVLVFYLTLVCWLIASLWNAVVVPVTQFQSIGLSQALTLKALALLFLM